MSSQLTSLTLVLDGTNYQQWSAAMQSFLMSQGQWKCVKTGAIASKVITIEAADGTKSFEGEKELEYWNEVTEKALGNIRLRLHHTIAYQYNDEENPAILWGSLKTKYGDPGTSQAFIEFKGIMDTVIPNNGDPSPACDKIMAHQARLKNMSFDIPDHVLAMIILSKIPSNMETTAQLMMISSKDPSSTKAKEPNSVIEVIRASWETSTRTSIRTNQQRANKLSAVRPVPNQPPVFQQQQQQQRGDWQQGRGGRGGTRQGKRGGRKNAQQQLQQATVQTQPSPGSSQLPPPPSQWVPAPSPYVPGPSPYAPGPAESGYFASRISASRPLPPTPIPSSNNSVWSSFSRSVDLAHKLDVPTTTETLKRLEMAELSKTRDTRDPRPRKRAKKNTPRGEIQGLKGSVKGKEKVKDDDVVSLDFTEDEGADMIIGRGEEEGPDGLFEDLMDDSCALENEESNVDGEATDMAGLELFRQVKSTSIGETEINSKLQLDTNIAELCKINKFCCSCSHKCDCDDGTKNWLIDSGASNHFTNDMNDFVEYQKLKKQLPVKTANSSAHMLGYGTIIVLLKTVTCLRLP